VACSTPSDCHAIYGSHEKQQRQNGGSITIVSLKENFGKLLFAFFEQ
jgi:hypothetical protein